MATGVLERNQALSIEEFKSELEWAAKVTQVEKLVELNLPFFGKSAFFLPHRVTSWKNFRFVKQAALLFSGLMMPIGGIPEEFGGWFECLLKEGTIAPALGATVYVLDPEIAAKDQRGILKKCITAAFAALLECRVVEMMPDLKIKGDLE